MDRSTSTTELVVKKKPSIINLCGSLHFHRGISFPAQNSPPSPDGTKHAAQAQRGARVPAHGSIHVHGPRARNVSAHHTRTPRAPSTDSRTPRHRPCPGPGRKAQQRAKPWLPLQSIHAERARPNWSPPTAAKSLRKAVTRQQKTQAAKTLSPSGQSQC